MPVAPRDHVAVAEFVVEGVAEYVDVEVEVEIDVNVPVDVLVAVAVEVRVAVAVAVAVAVSVFVAVLVEGAVFVETCDRDGVWDRVGVNERDLVRLCESDREGVPD